MKGQEKCRSHTLVYPTSCNISFANSCVVDEESRVYTPVDGTALEKKVYLNHDEIHSVL